ncbi:protein ALP1-like [Senna tora]|uniref:Protein ALP1-like n=1 Tax=Senna tora TaxID=362788 RepID=A0A834XCB2_9FABA|nr:protein ALP1-like [Senna tora]
MHEARRIGLRRNRLRDRSFTLEFHEKRTRLRSLVYSNDCSCYNVLRMYRNTFDRLCSMLDEIGGLKPTKHLLVDEQVELPRCTGWHTRKDAQFIYVLSGWEGSAAASRVLKSALSRPRGFKVPAEQYYWVDAGYSNAQGFLAPFKGQRYHLNEWREGRHPTNPREYFNMRHSVARNVIERCFRMLKNRLAILRSPSFYNVRTHNVIVIVCCLLHNLIRRENAHDPLDDEIENLVPEPVEEPTEDDPTIRTIESSEIWTLFRENLAAEMFNDFRCGR